VRSETTKDRAGALPPAVYSSQPSCTKVVFHEDSQDHSVTENQEEIEQNMPPVADHDHKVTGVVTVCEMTDLPVQEDKYDTHSESDREDDTPPDITVTRSGQAIRAHFCLDL